MPFASKAGISGHYAVPWYEIIFQNLFFSITFQIGSKSVITENVQETKTHALFSVGKKSDSIHV